MKEKAGDEKPRKQRKKQKIGESEERSDDVSDG